jgi:penicillin-binding protein 2
MMIGYGPVEDPQIAFAIAIEYGGGGSRASNLVVDIFNAYFFAQSNTLQPVQEGTLLE